MGVGVQSKAGFNTFHTCYVLSLFCMFMFVSEPLSEALHTKRVKLWQQLSGGLVECKAGAIFLC